MPDELKAALKDGSLTEADIDNALRPKFRIELKLGLLDPPEMVPYTSIKDSPLPWDTDSDRAVSQKMALESVVLLKNQDNFLPLDKKKIKSIAVIGPLADVVHWDWYGGTPPYAITPLQGIQKEVGPDVKVNYAAYDTPSGEDAALEAASKSDVAVVVIGNNPTCGDEGHAWYEHGTLPCTDPGDGREGRDRETMDLYQEQIVKQVYIKNPHTVVDADRQLSLTPSTGLKPTSPPSSPWPTPRRMKARRSRRSSSATYNPGGHLVRTWPQSADQLPPRMDYNIRDGYTYMYFKGQPLYPVRLRPQLHHVQILQPPHQLKARGQRRLRNRERRRHQQRQPRRRRSRPALCAAPAFGGRRARVRSWKASSASPSIPARPKPSPSSLPASQLAYWDVHTHAFRVEAEPVSLMIGDSSANIALKTTVQVE